MANRRLFQFRYSYERDLVDLYAQAVMNAAGLAPALGRAAGYGVAASSTITNTGSSTINGNLALYPGTSVTGAPTVTGSSHINDATAHNVMIDANAAYVDLQGRAFTQDLSGIDLGSAGTLSAGVYKFSSSAGLTGTLTLNGSATDVFIFQIGSTLTTAASSHVVLTGGALPGNVFFAVGSSATIGTSSTMQGNIIAQASVTMTTSATSLGALIALTGAVTLDTNVITAESPTAPSVLGQVLSNNKGIVSMIRNSTGNYTINMKDPFNLFMGLDLKMLSGANAPSAPLSNIVSQDVSGAQQVVLQLRNSSGNPADPANGEIMYLHIVCRNAST